jgi:hypothetical protein
VTLAYAFEASSIQNFILDGGKLRDISGGSALVDGLCNYPAEGRPTDLVEHVLDAVGWASAQFVRRGGGAFVLLASDDQAAQLRAFRALWTLTVQTYLAGLPFTDAEACSAGDDQAAAMTRVMNKLQRAASRIHPALPVTPPLARRDRRTGQPAVTRCRITQERIDGGIQAKRMMPRNNSLTRKFVASDAVRWPIRMDREEAGAAGDEVFPLLANNSYVGVIHADGNGLGDLVRKVQQRLAKEEPQTFADPFLKFSKSIAQATERAAATATQVVLEKACKEAKDGQPIMPMRPVVLGGDDLTVIVRGDLALEFARDFLNAFVVQTGIEFAALKHANPAFADLPTHLSAGAGIAFVKSTQPFQLAYGLSESLAKLAKTRAKAAKSDGGIAPSCVAFHRVTTAMIDDYEEIKQRELVSEESDPVRRELSLNPYMVHPGTVSDAPFACLAPLLSLACFLNSENVARGPLRLLARLALATPHEAEQIYQRWRTVMQESERRSKVAQSDGSAPQLGTIDAWLRDLGCTAPERHPWRYEDGVQRTPILDALSCVAVSKADDAAETESAA